MTNKFNFFMISAYAYCFPCPVMINACFLKSLQQDIYIYIYILDDNPRACAK